MASRKEYNMLFALNAKMNSGFNGAFSKAQAEFAKLGKEIQGLNRLQADISSYQKQQSAVEATRAKLENLQKQHDLLQKEIEETNGSTASLEREKLKLDQRIQDTTAGLERQNQKLDATGSRLKDAGVNTANLSQKDAELTAKIKELESAQEKAAEGASSFGEKAAQAFSAVQQAIVAAGVASALKEIANAYMECVTIAGDFEAAMSNVAALSGATAGEMAALTAEAKELGATTKFTAQESADAMGYMAMAGWDAQEMVSGMDGVLQLAAASGEDLAMVSDIVTDSLSAFGLTAADTAHFSDVLAAAATNSNTNVAIMGETFKMSASVAGALGYSVEDVATAVGLMANSGVKGSIAGTALRNTFNGLLDGVSLTGAAFGEYQYSAVKADGTMKDFGSTIEELRGYFEQMTESERVNNAMTIAGKRGYNGLLAILNATNEDYASLTGSINNCAGAAAKMSKIKLDNMNGQLVLMNSAWDALKTTLGEQFIPVMRGLFEVGTQVFQGLDSFVAQHPALVKAVAAFTAVLGTATVGLTAYAAAAKIAKALDLATLFTGPAGAVIGAIAGIAALTAGVVGFIDMANAGVPAVEDLTAAAQDMQETMDKATAAYEDTVTETQAAANIADTYISKLEEMGDYASLSAEEQKQYHNTLALLCETVPDLAGHIDLTTNTIDGGTEALRANTEEWKKNAMAQAYQEQLKTLYASYSDVLLETEKNSIGLSRAQDDLDAANEQHGETLAKMKQLYAEAQREADAYSKKSGVWADATEFLTQEYYDLETTLDGLEDKIYLSERSMKSHQDAIDADAGAVADAEAEIALAVEAIERLTGVTKSQTDAEAAAAQQAQEVNGVIDGVMGRVAALTETYSNLYAAAYDSISSQYALWDEAAEVSATSAGSINSAMESQITYWQDYNANLESLRDRTSDIEGLGDVIASFADGSADSVNAIAGLAGATDEELADMVSNWKKLQEEQDAASGSIADLKADFTDTMDELQEELTVDIEAMDLGDKAAASGKATMQGYIDGMDSMLGPVQAAGERFARAVSAALAPSRSTALAGLQKTSDLPGYASGTQDADPGYAWVGEHGPEIVLFGGGEQVLNASETAAFRAQSSVQTISAESAILAERPQSPPISFQVNFRIEGNATQETVRELQAYGGQFAEQVLEVLEQYRVDAARGAFR